MEIISFKERKQNLTQKQCKHNNIIVDEDLFILECEDCEKEMNPIEYLIKLARREKIAGFKLNCLNDLISKTTEKLKTRNRTKCQHCGKMTAIMK